MQYRDDLPDGRLSCQRLGAGGSGQCSRAAVGGDGRCESRAEPNRPCVGSGGLGAVSRSPVAGRRFACEDWAS